jgi:hypothetical protein
MALAERIRTQGPTAVEDPHKPVYLVAEFVPDVGDRVKVWFADGHGGSAEWLGEGRWEFTHPDEMAPYGPPVKWQELPPVCEVDGSSQQHRKKTGCNAVARTAPAWRRVTLYVNFGEPVELFLLLRG